MNVLKYMYSIITCAPATCWQNTPALVSPVRTKAKRDTQLSITERPRCRVR